MYIPSYTIKISSSVVNNLYCKYPFFSYNNIVYLPLTWEHAQYLGFYAHMDDSNRLNVATINAIDNTIPLSTNDKAYTLGVPLKAFKANFNIVIYDDNNYPFLSYNGITYIPLTSNIATKLSLQVQWNDETGFAVNKLAKQ